MPATIEALRAKAADHKKQAEAILADADANSDGVLTEDQHAQVKGHTDHIKSIDASIKARDGFDVAIGAHESEPIRRVPKGQPSAGLLNHEVDAYNQHTVTGGSPRNDDAEAFGFRSMGEFAMAVKGAYSPGGSVDKRLAIAASAATTYAGESSGSDGGFLVPPQFGTQIYQHSLEGDALLPLTDNIPVERNTISFPSDETTPWGSTGIFAEWLGEGTAATPRKPILKSFEVRLHKLIALVPMSDELLEDATALETYISGKVSAAIRYKANDAIINGTGTGQPLGVANSGVLVSQAKVGSQTADTIVAGNVTGMFGRLPGSSISTSVWVVANDAYNQLPLMTIGDTPVFTPPGSGIKDAPAGSVLGRPVIISPSATTIGDVGDIYLLDLKSYVTATKSGGMQTATSMHLYFDADQTAFRATFRLGGRPWLTSAITPPNSAVTLSPFVTLAARA